MTFKFAVTICILLKMVPPARIERATSPLPRVCSTTEPRRHEFCFVTDTRDIAIKFQKNQAEPLKFRKINNQKL